jgi:two-component system CheB/CheR fusion protein
MISDAPFTKVDLVSCRNTLIYFESALQEVVLKRFQYALGVERRTVPRFQREPGPLAARLHGAELQRASIFRALRPAVLSLEALQTATQAGMRRACDAP